MLELGIKAPDFELSSRVPGPSGQDSCPPSLPG